MNEPNRTIDLDTCARQAAAGVRQSVRDAELSSKAPRRAGGRRLVLAAVAALVVIAGVVALTRGGDEPREGGIASSGAATPLAPDPVPEGMSFTGAFQAPIAVGPDESMPSEIAVHTSPEDDGPTLLAMSLDREPELGTPTLELIEYEGRPFYVESTEQGEAVSWVDEPSGRSPLLVGSGLSRDQVLTAALSTSLDGDVPVVDPSALPEGMEHLATVPYGVATPLASALALVEGAGGIGYADEGQTRTLEVNFALAGERWLEASRALMVDPQSLEVRGQPAYGGGVSPELTGATLVWIEADGTFVRLTGYGLDLDDLTEIAGTLRPLAPAEWQDLLDRSEQQGGSSAEAGSEVEEVTATFGGMGQPIDPNEAPLLDFVAPEGADGAASLRLAGVPELTLRIDPDDQPAVAWRRFGLFVFGVVPADTERLVIGADGTEIEVTSFEHVRDGVDFPAWAFIAEVPIAAEPTLTAYLEDGSTVVSQG